jgi:DNA-binding Lrp family transcriptional regulator
MTSRTRTPQSGEFERDTEQARLDADAAELRSRGMSYRAIAKAQDVSPSTAMDRVKRAIAAVPVEAVEHLRSTAGEQLDALTRTAFTILMTKHPMVSHGKVIPDVEDYGPKLRAIAELRRLNESRRKLYGIDSPVRVEHTVTTAMEQEILALAAEFAVVDPDSDH